MYEYLGCTYSLEEDGNSIALVQLYLYYSRCGIAQYVVILNTLKIIGVLFCITWYNKRRVHLKDKEQESLYGPLIPMQHFDTA